MADRQIYGSIKNVFAIDRICLCDHKQSRHIVLTEKRIGKCTDCTCNYFMIK